MHRPTINDPVQYLKGVGPRRAVQLRRAGIETVGDLLYYFPKRYEDRRTTIPFNRMAKGQTVWMQGRVLGGAVQRPRKGLSLTKLALESQGVVFHATWFNQPFVLQQLVPGTEVVVVGRCSRRFNSMEIAVSEWEIAGQGPVLSTGRIVPVYPLTEGLNQKAVRCLTHSVLHAHPDPEPEFLPDDIRSRYDLPELYTALWEIHYPSTPENAARARNRFVCEECLLFQLALAKRRIAGDDPKPFRHGPDGTGISALIDSLPFALTRSQRRVWTEISHDMQSPKPMRRLLQGDVGSGKTIIALLALVKATEAGLQGALMAPTEILAEQHYRQTAKMLTPLGLEVELLLGGQPPRERALALKNLRSGQSKLVVGTHALIQESVVFANLGLVVIDEQHRFGVKQRMLLQDKGLEVDSLVMTATPIPRTLALTLYGDLDVSTINELPPGRRPVNTHFVYPSRLPRVYEFVRREVTAGRQAYIICPLVEESEQLENEAAVNLYEELRTGPLQRLRLGLLHGRMPGDEKSRVISAFNRGELDVLVSTTVVEVGVDVPNATVMVVFDAERFGLAQLHQLRGRVGRGAAQSWCILVGQPKTDEARERIKTITSTTDGFKLAETDLRLRGPGEFLGTRQAGLPGFKVTDLVNDWKFVEDMRREAQILLAGDPDLSAPEYQPIAQKLEPLIRKLSL
ncbi:MAG: ATP-dependent DNA helicase RecG [Desulforudis sp.]|nr:MAG: ATP-dependent DNA helicase RecG [Desulforudis sp.]